MKYFIFLIAGVLIGAVSTIIYTNFNNEPNLVEIGGVILSNSESHENFYFVNRPYIKNPTFFNKNIYLNYEDSNILQKNYKGKSIIKGELRAKNIGNNIIVTEIKVKNISAQDN